MKFHIKKIYSTLITYYYYTRNYSFLHIYYLYEYIYIYIHIYEYNCVNLGKFRNMIFLVGNIYFITFLKIFILANFIFLSRQRYIYIYIHIKYCYYKKRISIVPNSRVRKFPNVFKTQLCNIIHRPRPI